MARILTFTNQKGGVGKTSMALNFAVHLKVTGARVLLVDMDPQCSLTYIAGIDDPRITIMEVMAGQATAAQAVLQGSECEIIPASPNLSAADITFTNVGKEYILRDALKPLGGNYDFIVIDSPPTLGILTINILTAANEVIIPALADVFSLQGVGQLYSTIQAVQKYCNPTLKIAGVVLSRHTERLLLSRELRRAMENTAEQIGSQLFRTSIRESVVLREAQANRKSIFKYAPRSRQTDDYARLVTEYLKTVQQAAKLEQGAEAHGE